MLANDATLYFMVQTHYRELPVLIFLLRKFQEFSRLSALPWGCNTNRLRSNRLYGHFLFVVPSCIPAALLA